MPPRNERGALTPAVIILIVLLLPLGALVADAGKQINAKLKAQAIAEEAARAGATYIQDLATEQTKPNRQSRSEAQTAVRMYCDRAQAQHRGASQDVTTCEFIGTGTDIQPNKAPAYYVQTKVQLEVSSSLLGLLGINDLTATATAKAYAVTGILGPGEDWFQGKYTPSVSYPPFTPPISTGNTSMPVTTITRPTEYPTTACGDTFTFPLTVAASCVTTTTEVPTATVTKTRPGKPPPKKGTPSPTSVTTTLTTPSPTTTWTLVPTSATPPGWGG